jgi:hypothetical protein
MNAIRMVWIISRHYNTDLRMVPLMERIAYKIAEKVETEVDIKTIVTSESPELARAVIDEARTVLHSWESTYMAVRQRIEESGTHIRWEFDRGTPRRGAIGKPTPPRATTVQTPSWAGERRRERQREGRGAPGTSLPGCRTARTTRVRIP